MFDKIIFVVNIVTIVIGMAVLFTYLFKPFNSYMTRVSGTIKISYVIKDGIWQERYAFSFYDKYGPIMDQLRDMDYVTFKVERDNPPTLEEAREKEKEVLLNETL